MKSIIIYGAGGHAKVVADIAEHLGLKIKYFYADNSKEDEFFGYPLVSDADQLESDLNSDGSSLIIAIGDNSVRRKVFDKYQKFDFATLIHPSATIARDVQIGEGSVVMAGVKINPSVEIGQNVIINTNASVDHDSVIMSHTHIAPGVTICGGVRIGENCLLGVGSSVIPGVQINENVTIGAGGVVVSSVESNKKLVGVPAKTIKE